MTDAYGRSLSYLRVSITQDCNLRCRYCAPEGASPLCGEAALSFDDLFTLVRAFVRRGVRKVRVTGGEPLTRPGVTAFIARVAALPGVREVDLTTNGLLLARQAAALKAAGLSRVNVSLDSLSYSKYREITGGGHLSAALEGIAAAKRAGLGPVKVNTVLIRGFNDGEVGDFIEWSHEQDVEVRFIELMPIGCGRSWAKERFLSAAEVLAAHPALIPAGRRDLSSTAALYRVAGSRARIGFITPMSCDFCAHCSRLRLSACGRVRACLHSARETDLTPGLADPALLDTLIAQTAAEKPRAHRLAQGEFVPEGMYRIGG